MKHSEILQVINGAKTIAYSKLNLQQIRKLNAMDNNEIIYSVELAYTMDQLLKISKNFTAYQDQEATIEHLQIYRKFLYDRWQRIKGTDLIYSYATWHPTTLVCLKLAEVLAVTLNINKYTLLMPGVNTRNDAILVDLAEEENTQLHHFVLDDTNTCIIEVVSCLDFAQEDGLLKHTVFFDGQAMPLNLTEKDHVINHSQETRDYFSVIQNMVSIKKYGISIGAHMQRLVDRLRQGGKRKASDATEMRAGAKANEGIVEFSKFLETLAPNVKDKLFSCSGRDLSIKNFGECWDRLSNPKGRAEETIYCVEIIAGNIDTILNDNPWLFEVNFDVLQTSVNKAKEALYKAMQERDYNVLSSYGMKGKERLAWYFRTLIISDCAKLSGFCTFLSTQRQKKFIWKNFFKCLGQQHLQTIIKNTDDLFIVLQSIPKKTEYLDLISSLSQEHLKTLIPDVHRLIVILTKLSRSSWPKFLNLFSQHLEKLISRAEQFAFVLRELQDTDRTTFFIALGQEEEHLEKLIPNVNHLVSIQKQLNDMVNWRAFSELIGLKRLKKLIKDGEQLAVLLENFDEGERMTFFESLGLEYWQGIIENGYQLAVVLEKFSTREGKNILNLYGLNHLQDMIKDGYQLAAITEICDNREKKEIFFHSFDPKWIQEIIGNGIQLGVNLQYVNKANWYGFLNAFNPERLQTILKNGSPSLEKISARVRERIFSLSGKLGNECQLAAILMSVPSEDWRFLFNSLDEEHLSVFIKNGYDLKTILTELSETDYTCFFDSLGAEKIRSIITDDLQLEEVLKCISHTDHLSSVFFNCQHVSRQASLSFILEHVEKANWNHFFNCLIKESKFKDVCKNVLRLLPIKEDWKTFFECFNAEWLIKELCSPGISTNYPQIIEVMSDAQPVNRLFLLKECLGQKCLHNVIKKDVRIFCQLLSILPETAWSEFFDLLGQEYLLSFLTSEKKLVNILLNLPDKTEMTFISLINSECWQKIFIDNKLFKKISVFTDKWGKSFHIGTRDADGEYQIRSQAEFFIFLFRILSSADRIAFFNLLGSECLRLMFENNQSFENFSIHERHFTYVINNKVDFITYLLGLLSDSNDRIGFLQWLGPGLLKTIVLNEEQLNELLQSADELAAYGDNEVLAYYKGLNYHDLEIKISNRVELQKVLDQLPTDKYKMIFLKLLDRKHVQSIMQNVQNNREQHLTFLNRYKSFKNTYRFLLQTTLQAYINKQETSDWCCFFSCSNKKLMAARALYQVMVEESCEDDLAQFSKTLRCGKLGDIHQAYKETIQNRAVVNFCTRC